jgi:hypothetical protein
LAGHARFSSIVAAPGHGRLNGKGYVVDRDEASVPLNQIRDGHGGLLGTRAAGVVGPAPKSGQSRVVMRYVHQDAS